ncbi:MAG: sensor histidine kinase [Acidimicrobiales bacterium]
MPEGPAARAIAEAVAHGRPEIARQEGAGAGTRGYHYAAALPVLQGAAVTGALLIVGDARDPFAALDTGFLVALGQHVGAALESAALYRRVEERRRELERLAARMVQQHEAERLRLSRELHDETAQVLSAVRLKLGVLREQATPGLTDRLDDALRLMDAGIQSIRNVTNALRPSLLDDLGLVPALRGLVQDVSDRTGLHVRLEVPDQLPPLSNEAEVALFRALQEGLTNVVRHAGARSVMVTLDGAAGEVALRIRDDGHGPPSATFDDLERDGHRGLAGMRERITALGGSLAVRAGQGRGCELVVRLPDASRGAA